MRTDAATNWDYILTPPACDEPAEDSAAERRAHDEARHGGSRIIARVDSASDSDARHFGSPVSAGFQDSTEAIEGKPVAKIDITLTFRDVRCDEDARDELAIRLRGLANYLMRKADLSEYSEYILGKRRAQEAFEAHRQAGLCPGMGISQGYWDELGRLLDCEV